MKKITKYLTAIEDYLISKLGSKSCYVIGVSCGLDSVLVLELLAKAFQPERIRAYFIDINSIEDKKYFGVIKDYFLNKYSIEIKNIDLNNEYDLLIDKLNVQHKNGFGNIASKLRSMYLYNEALEHDGLVVNTTNYSEYYLGHFTKFGDSNGDVFPILGIAKSDLKMVANHLQLPQEIINRNPTSGFLRDANDEVEFGFSYDDLNRFLTHEKIDDELKEKILHVHEKNIHKKKLLNPWIWETLRRYRR